MAQFSTLYSGSSGNSTLITDSGTSLLVDMGCSCRKTLASLYELGRSAADIEAILITHEHIDHTSGLMTFLKHYPVPVHGPSASLAYLRNRGMVPESAELIATDKTGFSVGGIQVRPFRTSHDSLDCVGYKFHFADGKTLALATDLGYVSDDVYEALYGCDLVALESNYDEEMLDGGSYPYYLKSRIRSMTGHLCNDESSAIAAQLAQCGTKRLFLMHLSKENNEPELALTTCLGMLENHGVGERDCDVCIAPRHSISEPVEV